MKGFGFVLIAGLLLTDIAEAIRVYEGTNLAPPTGKTCEEPCDEPPNRYLLGKLTDAKLESRSDVQRRQAEVKFAKDMKPTPNLYKVKLTQRGYLQFLRYLTDVPPLREYTFCLWFKSNNLTHPQPLFSYTGEKNEKLLSFRYQPRDYTLRMSIRRNLAFKVPALIRENKWHHVCQSWNGIFGKWMIFLDGSKIGSGVLNKYKATYVPGGGEIVLGQEPGEYQKGLEEGVEGEVFGFNLVDESVNDEIVLFNRPRFPDETPPETTTYVPPFKALPPMKKSYQDIKAFVAALPSTQQFGPRTPPKIAPGGHPISKPRSKPPKRMQQPRPRNKPRTRYKPPALRKTIVYEREDRQLRPDALIKKMGQLPGQAYDENYSIHTYRSPKNPPGSNYEIYETPDEDFDQLQRKVRQSFDIRTARQENHAYAAATRNREQKPALEFHFERARSEKSKQGIRRSLTVETTPGTRPVGYIPVHEIVDDVPYHRRKREAADLTEDLASDFRPLPKIPESFISLLSDKQNETKSKSSSFFPDDTFDKAPPAVTPAELRRNLIVNMNDLERKPGISSGTELVRRSFEECWVGRGSPVSNKDRLVVSWAETPVRIYGGAMVTSASHSCGYF